MECKYDQAVYIGKHKRELIDTLWNVNGVLVVRGASALQELIDTLWNVNVFEEHNEESFNEN